MSIGTGARCGVFTPGGLPCQRPAVHGGPCVWHDPKRKPVPRAWPLSRRWRLMTMLEEGCDDAAIGAALGCSPEAVKLARKRYGIAPKSRTVLTARQVALRLGVSCAKSVVRWIAAGWLRGHRAWRVGTNRAWLVREADLHAFLADPEHFHRWDPARIPDRALREWATAQRDGVRFLTLTEAAEWLCRQRSICVERDTVGAWLDKGWLPFVRNGNRLVREADLTAFEPHPFGGRPKRGWAPCAACGDAGGKRRRGCVTPTRCRADRYGVPGLVCLDCYHAARRAWLRGEAAT